MKFSDEATETRKRRGNSVQLYLQKRFSLFIKHII